MKRFLLSVIILACTFSSKAQYITIPDPGLRGLLMEQYPQCFNASEQLDTTCTAILNEIYFQPIGFGVSDWQGFQYFRNLQVIDLTSISILSVPPLPNTLRKLIIPIATGVTSLPALPAGLTTLIFGNSSITSLPALPASLDTLECSGDSLTSLPVLPASLKRLVCDYNKITSLPALPAQLQYLKCGNNLMTGSLSNLPNTLVYLHADYNQFTGIGVLPAALTDLDVSYNSISGPFPSLPAGLKWLMFRQNYLISSVSTLPAGLMRLDCSGNQLTVLPELPATLLELWCGGNQLTEIPVLPASLNTLECTGTLITSLPDLPAGLQTLACGGNHLTGLPPLPASLFSLQCASDFLYYLPEIPPNLYILECTNNHIQCMPVLPNTSMIISMDSIITCLASPLTPSIQLNVLSSTGFTFYNLNNQYPVCSAINNINHCDAFPLMTGYVYNDNNNNNIHDAGEPYRANIKVQLSNGAWTYSNNDGYYQLPADDTGHYTLSVLPPNYFTSSPLQYNYYFTNFDTLVANDFALQASSTADSVHISITPVNAAARPGFAYPYLISYDNGGTTTVSPNIIFNYDNTRLIYDSSSNAAVMNTGNSLTLAETGFVAGQRKSFTGYFRVSPSAVIGDSLRSYAHISANAVSNHDSTVVPVRGSYDPNDKSATSKLLTTQVANGDYIYYTIRFQNTGTDTAFNVVITDTLDNKLQSATLQITGTSHSCKTTVKGNSISFEFINILLPDSNVNQLASHGYVSFRVKPLNNLVANTTVPNKAFIYFDYNSPVVTNTAITTIVEPVLVPLKLLSFTANRGAGLTANLSWQTNDEVNVRNYTIEMSTTGRTFSAVAGENAKGYQYNSYTKQITIPPNNILYFRLMMTDIDGNYTYSNIVILRNDKEASTFSFLSNPVNDELDISLLDESLKNTTATIFTAQGIKVKSILLLHDVEKINTRALPAGAYYLVTQKGSKQFVVVK